MSYSQKYPMPMESSSKRSVRFNNELATKINLNGKLLNSSFTAVLHEICEYGLPVFEGIHSNAMQCNLQDKIILSVEIEIKRALEVIEREERLKQVLAEMASIVSRLHNNHTIEHIQTLAENIQTELSLNNENLLISVIGDIRRVISHCMMQKVENQQHEATVKTLIVGLSTPGAVNTIDNVQSVTELNEVEKAMLGDLPCPTSD